MSREVPDGYERLWEVAGRHGRLRMVTGGYVWNGWNLSTVSQATGLERLEFEYLKLESEYLQLRGWNG